MTTFRSFYESFAQQPLLLWVAAAAGHAVVLFRKDTSRSVRVFCVAWGLVPFFDAWLTAEDVAGIGSLRPPLAMAAGIFFAIVGDLRVFLFLEGATPEGEIAVTRGGVLRAVGWSLLVPVGSAIARGYIPDTIDRGRATFLVYEVAFLIVMAVRWIALPGEAEVWARRVIAFVVLYYALWASADVLLLGWGLDAGFLLRTAANALYYGGLLAAISVTAPRPDPARAG